MGHLQRLIVFDLDGTLIDSRRDLADSANQLIQEFGGAPLPEDAIGRMVGGGAAVLVRRALAAVGIAETPAALPRFLDIYDHRLVNHTRVYAGIPDVVHAARRHARLAVLTNKPGRPSDRILAALGLRDLFDEVIGGDGPWPRKPDPASLVAMMERTGATTATTMLVGDSIIDRATAAGASVPCCLAGWGFGFETSQAGPLAENEWIAREPSDLALIIDGFVARRA